MNYVEKWIWLPRGEYPEHQTTKYSHFSENGENNYAVAEFKRRYTFEKKVERMDLRFSGDTEFQLFLNDEIIATGPAVVEGDFIGNDSPRNNFYATGMTVFPDSETVDFFARVKMMPVKMCDYSMGHGGFMLTAHITFSDGTKTVICTDKTWQARYNGAYTKPYEYDARILPDEYIEAEEIDNIWHTTASPLLVRDEKEIFPENQKSAIVNPHDAVEEIFEFDMIYAGFMHLFVKAKGELQIEVFAREIEETGSFEKFVFDKDGEYRGIEMHSAGKFFVKIKNNSDFPAEVSPSLITTYYPVLETAETTTSDEDLNEVLSVCAHTLKYCRQLHHLDSPRHCEPLACTGDYYIESLMTAFSFGDMSLAEFDILRTSELLRNNDGRMFHTTYSLIWVRMLYDVYMFTGNMEMLKKCEDALILLLNRFETYIGEDGIIDNPPDYMFVDWIYIDELSMHHPPKALGQTCLNMFYFGALEYAARIFAELSEDAMSEKCTNKKEELRAAVNEVLFDKEKQLYFEGLNTKTSEDKLYQFMPQNTEKRYYLKHANILAVYFGICNDALAKKLIEKVMTNECPGDYQPYFAHYLFEAIYKNGLRDKYTIALAEIWKPSIKDCRKGLAEGFVKPEPTYVFDHSHAWGGTPLYSVPKAILGLEIVKPGMSEISLSPSLLGLKDAEVELLTPYGKVVCKLAENAEPVITAPDEIKIHIR